jgi:glycosyltransferase involved in cell wall biosynthesis
MTANSTLDVSTSVMPVPGGRSPAPVVSIGVPVYNGARFLSQALDSLLGQSFSNLELIISDNASTDQTERICRAYAGKDTRVRYFRQTANIGAPRNWNFVAKEARGRYFKWSSGNDFCPSDMVEKCVAVMEDDAGVVLCYGRTCLVDEETNSRKEYSYDIAVLEGLPHERFRTLYRTLALNNAQSGLIRADALRRTRYDRPYPHGDVVLMAELALQGKFVLLPDVLLYRRMGRDTFSSLLSPAEMQVFFDPKAKRGVGLWHLRMHLDFFVTVLRASLGLPEKLRTLMLVLRHAIWDRKKLWVELRDRLVGARHA